METATEEKDLAQVNTNLEIDGFQEMVSESLDQLEALDAPTEETSTLLGGDKS